MTAPAPRSTTVFRAVLATLVVNLFVIVWGAWVRASGSGAGCGNHWPTCNGQIIPQSPTLHTVIEFTHRLSSSVALLLVLWLVMLTRRAFPRGHLARRGAVASVILIVIEALIGAGLVKFDLVADNASLQRAFSLGVHLVNTLFLLGAIALTGWWADGGGALRERGPTRWWFALAAAALILVGMTGAVTSLGDTLFPAASFAEGLARDGDPTTHLLVRLRVWHPTFAVITGLGVVLLALASGRRLASYERPARAVTALVLTQWSVGVLSLLSNVPVALQLLHLLTADFLWLAFVWLAATVLSDYEGRTIPASKRAASASNTVPAPSSR